VREIYDVFDQQRKAYDAKLADEEDLRELEQKLSKRKENDQ